MERTTSVVPDRPCVADNAGQSIKGISDKVNSGVEELMSYAKQHLAEWEGSAQTSYYQVEAQWRQAQSEMASALARAQSALAEMHQLIQQGEQKGSGLWQDTPVGFR